MVVATNRHKVDVWKIRLGPAGLHLFNRATGLNILLDEVHVPTPLYSRAPRQVSIALTNRCDLACTHCYAPKSRNELSFDAVTQWLDELDSNGGLSVGFGGGEPTLHRDFARLCQHAATETGLSVSFTTHGHHISDGLAEELRGSVNFVRVSMDGIGETYESTRQRSFTDLLARLKCVRTISRFGINVVVNERTLPELSQVAGISADAGACELLLLPQMAARRVSPISADAMQRLRLWVDAYEGPLRLCINEASAEGFPICDPLIEEQGLRSYAHIDASGVLKPSSYAEGGVCLEGGSLLEALDQLIQNLAKNDR